MGTNYYLRKKATYIPKKDRPENWWENYDFDFYDSFDNNLVVELTNGYTWNNTYYPTVEELNKVYYLEYHIGKNSAGWRFLLQTYPKQDITSLNDWKKLFDENEIYDEYGEKVSKEEMLNIITKKEPWHNLKDKNTYIDGSGTYTVRDGLLVHPLCYGIIDNSQKETYDIHDGGDFC